VELPSVFHSIAAAGQPNNAQVYGSACKIEDESE